MGSKKKDPCLWRFCQLWMPGPYIIGTAGGRAHHTASACRRPRMPPGARRGVAPVLWRPRRPPSVCPALCCPVPVLALPCACAAALLRCLDSAATADLTNGQIPRLRPRRCRRPRAQDRVAKHTTAAAAPTAAAAAAEPRDDADPSRRRHRARRDLPTPRPTRCRRALRRRGWQWCGARRLASGLAAAASRRRPRSGAARVRGCARGAPQRPRGPARTGWRQKKKTPGCLEKRKRKKKIPGCLDKKADRATAHAFLPLVLYHYCAVQSLVPKFCTTHPPYLLDQEV